MKEFLREITKIADRIEALARMVEDDNNMIEYFCEAYGYLDGDDAVPVVIKFLCDQLNTAE